MSDELKIAHLPVELARRYLSYDASTGELRWRERPYKSRVSVGDVAGSRNPRTFYWFVGIGGEVYASHHVAWLLHHGEPAPGQIDHVNGDQGDNRIANLRLATASQNNANRRRHRSNKSGFKGVDLCKGRWRALAKKDGKQHYFGTFGTPEEAYAAYCAGIARLHGEFARAA